MKIDWKYWPVTRILKAIITVVFIVAALTGRDWFFLVPASFFGIQAVFNTGCGCSSQGCEIKPQVNTDLSKE